MARAFTHPNYDKITLAGILYALSDPVRLDIVAKLAQSPGMSCQKACRQGLSPSTISFHHKILRENGLIHSEKVGVEVINTLCKAEIDARFPGLLECILRLH